MRAIVAVAHPFVLLWRRWTRRDSPADPRQVVFVAEYPRVREAKLAWVLRRAGWRTHLIYVNPPNFDAHRFFDGAERATSPWRAYFAAARRTTRLFHLFSLSGDPYVALLTRHKLGKTIFDPVDILECHFRPAALAARGLAPVCAWTREAVARADALCARDLQSLYARRRFGYARPARVVFFPEYCWGEEVAGPGSEPPDGAELRVAVPGIFGLERDGEGDWGYLRIGKLLAQAGVHLHLFVHWMHRDASVAARDARFAEYAELRRTTGRVHFEAAVPIERVVERLRDFHFGMCVHDYAAFGEPSRTFDPAVHRYGSSGRNFEWLDAGRPVLTTHEFSLWWFLFGRYGMLIACPPRLEGIGEVLRAAATPARRAAMAAGREKLSLARHARRLTAFYESVLAGATGPDVRDRK